MDLVIQEPESALVVGTFGRAIWVLDDLLSLREIVAGRLKEKLTALPINDAVQVKGLFINPPGNIWTGFHTTFEGENKVFQKTKIPYYFDAIPDSNTVVTAEIYNSEKRMINSMSTTPNQKGLNYLIWKLDERSAKMPNAWKDDFSRDIPVLPGEFSIVLKYESEHDETSVNVIEDPRFDLDSRIDKELYDFRKAADVEVRRLVTSLHKIDAKKTALQQAAKDSSYSTATYKEIVSMEKALEKLRSMGQTPRPKRQLGAWQTYEVTPHSKLKEVLLVADARTTNFSKQHWQLLEEAKRLTATFNKETTRFMDGKWQSFLLKMKKKGIEIKE